MDDLSEAIGFLKKKDNGEWNEAIDACINALRTVLEEEEEVDHPEHYNSGRIEVIDFIEDQELGFHLGNAVKYIARAGKKDPAKVKEDLEKAVWYINRHLEKIL